MKKSVLFLISFLVLSVPSFAFGPIPITIYGGSAGGGISGTNAGANAVISLPLLPNFGIECESTNARYDDIDFVRTRVGGIYKMGFILFNINISAGTETLIITDTLNVGSITLADQTLSGSYVAIGPEVELFGWVIYPRAVATSYSLGTVAGYDINLGCRF